MAAYYEWFRAGHLISVLAWSAGLLMAPRFFAYQTEAEPGGPVDRLMVLAADRLMKVVMAPAMISAWLFGIATYVARFGGKGAPPAWFMVKFALALGLTIYHMYLASARKGLARGDRRHSGRYWRVLNEIPFLVMAVIVILAVVEPF